MIASFLLAAALAATPGPEPAPPQPPVAAKPASLDVPITLHIKDSSLVDLLNTKNLLGGVSFERFFPHSHFRNSFLKPKPILI